MALSILNNISALQAENQLSITTAAANYWALPNPVGRKIKSGSPVGHSPTLFVIQWPLCARHLHG